MKVKDLIGYAFDKIIIYKEVGECMGDYIDLYKGRIDRCTQELLEMEVKTIGAKKTGILDIRVK